MIVVIAASTFQLRTTQDGVFRPLRGEFARHNQHFADIAIAGAPFFVLRNNARELFARLVAFGSAESQVRRELAFLAAVTAEFVERRFEDVVEVDRLLSPFADARPYDPREFG